MHKHTKLTNPMEQSSSWKANRSLPGHGIPWILWNPEFYGIRKFITAFTAARHLSLSWARQIQSVTPSLFSKIYFNIFSHLQLGLLSGLFLSFFPLKFCTHFYSPHSHYIPCPSQSSWLYHPNGYVKATGSRNLTEFIFNPCTTCVSAANLTHWHFTPDETSTLILQ
jgi:hypothetical protein